MANKQKTGAKDNPAKENPAKEPEGAANGQDGDADESGASQPKKSRKLLLIGVAVVVLAVSSAAGWYFTQGGDTQEAQAEPVRLPVFTALDVFTVNLADTDQYLQVGLSLKVADSTVTDAIKLHNPEIRNELLMLLSSKRAAEVSTIEGKQKLADEVVAATRRLLPTNSPENGVLSVLFTSFVIQ